MGCTFCATGQMGFRRDLSEAEIFEQAARFSSETTRDYPRLPEIFEQAARFSSETTRDYPRLPEIFEQAARFSSELREVI